jgi:hypothetical protein
LKFENGNIAFSGLVIPTVILTLTQVNGAGKSTLLRSVTGRAAIGDSDERKSRKHTSEYNDKDLASPVSTILHGIFLGGLYALFSAGLSLIFGVMRLVNIAHGDLIVLSAFIALVVVGTLGIHPVLSLLVVVPLMALLGYGLQRGILNRTLGSDILPPLLVSFGRSVFLQNALLQIFSADSRRLHAGVLETKPRMDANERE